jgi:hypothetical protein
MTSAEFLSGTLSFQNGFHHADWNVVREWIQSNVAPENLDTAWSEAARCWVNKLREDLGGEYFVLESPQTILLSAQPEDTARWMLEYAGRAVVTIKAQLGDIAWQGAYGKDIVIVFSDDDDYYQYISHHTPDGEQAASGGVCIHSGYTHIAIPWRDELDAANAIIHELSHDCVAHLPLPLWLNEAVAVTLEKAVAPTPRGLGESAQQAISAAAIDWRAPIMWDELAERHFDFWNETNIQEFWAGTSYHVPGDSNELSYSLAQVLLKLITERTNPVAFRDFLRNARQDDAGQTAAMDILGIELGELAGTFLGPGDWRPKRREMIASWRNAGWKENTGEE